MGNNDSYSPRTVIFCAVLAAMQDAEEMGGPEGPEYLGLMLDIAAEANQRHAAFVDAQGEQDPISANSARIDKDPSLLPGVEELAIAFAQELRAFLTPERMRDVIDRNAADDATCGPAISPTCHTHDFCELMLWAFEKVAGFECDPTHDPSGDVMEAAHTMARQSGFSVERAPAYLRAPDSDSAAWGFEFRGVDITNPCSSECGRFVVSPRHYGFAISDTGGGCTAWTRSFEKGLQMVVTDQLDASHVIGSDGSCTVGVYDEATGDVRSMHDFDGPGSDPRATEFRGQGVNFVPVPRP